MRYVSLLCSASLGEYSSACQSLGWHKLSITQDEHDKQIKTDTERNTKYHNNADDYPANNPSTPVSAASTKRMEPLAPSAANREYEARMAHAEANAAENFRSWMADAMKGDA